ncbi:MAG: hypothetical protein AAGC67_00185 [Myxococcota bacterium]
MRRWIVLLAIGFASLGVTCEEGYRRTCTLDKGCYEPPPGTQGSLAVPRRLAEERSP